MSAPEARGSRTRSAALRSVVALIAALALAAGLAPPATAEGEPIDPLTTAAGWLARQLVDGERFEQTFGTDTFPDYGLTIDAVLAFAAAGVADDFGSAAAAYTARSANTTGYIGDGDAGTGVGEFYAGATAKLALLAQVRGLDPRAWGEDGVDLIARLLYLEDADGRFADQSQWGDFSNSIGQSIAIVVLHRQAGVDPSLAAIDMLLTSQCPDGGFALELNDQAACTSGVDSTAYAVQALLLAGRTTEAGAGLDWLASAQQDDGGFTSTDGTDGNANSTGVAAQALAVGGRDAEAGRAVAYLVGLQQQCDAPEADRGAIAFDESGFDAGTAVRATAQGVLGLAAVGLGDLDATGAAGEAPAYVCAVPDGDGSTDGGTDSGDGGIGDPGPSEAVPDLDPDPAALPTAPTPVPVAAARVTPAATPAVAQPTYTG
jgi:hypothetical protein